MPRRPDSNDKRSQPYLRRSQRILNLKALREVVESPLIVSPSLNPGSIPEVQRYFPLPSSNFSSDESSESSDIELLPTPAKTIAFATIISSSEDSSASSDIQLLSTPANHIASALSSSSAEDETEDETEYETEWETELEIEVDSEEEVHSKM